MSDNYIGEIRMFAGTFEPVGWMFCQGQTLAIAEYDALFQLIGTTYGGDGQETFQLPNLASRIPLHQGTGNGLSSFVLGQAAGVETVTLTTAKIPAHSHPVFAASGVGHLAEPDGAVPAEHRDFAAFDGAVGSTMASNSIGSAGGSQPHENMPPYLCVNFIISLFGIYPTPT